MELISLTDIHGNNFSNATFDQIKNAYLELFRLKGYGRNNYINIHHTADELAMEIYQQSIVLIDHIKLYDGPGGPSELFSVRYKGGTILPKLEEIIYLFQGAEVEKILQIINTLPKPDNE